MMMDKVVIENPISKLWITLLCRHNGRDSVSNHQFHGCLLNRLFRRSSKKPWKLCVTGLYAGNSPEIGEFPAQMASNAENVSIWWRHHVILPYHYLIIIIYIKSKVTMQRFTRKQYISSGPASLVWLDKYLNKSDMFEAWPKSHNVYHSFHISTEPKLQEPTSRGLRSSMYK